MSRSTIIQEIKTACRNASLQCLIAQSGGRHASIRESASNGELLAERMAYIFLTEWAIRIGFRICYDFESVARVSGMRFDLANAADQKRLTEFVKELANLIGGAIAQSLDGDNKIIGISLPVANRMVEPVKTRPTGRGIHSDVWELAAADGSSISFVLVIEIPNEAMLDSITVVSVSKSVADSDLEFL